MWEFHRSFKPLLTDLWQEKGKATSCGELQQKLEAISTKLKVWDRDSFGSVKRRINELTSELGRLRADPLRVGPSHAEIKSAIHS